MLYVKATAVGIVTGVLAPVAVAIIMAIASFGYGVAVSGGIAVTGGGGAGAAGAADAAGAAGAAAGAAGGAPRRQPPSPGKAPSKPEL